MKHILYLIFCSFLVSCTLSTDEFEKDIGKEKSSDNPVEIVNLYWKNALDKEFDKANDLVTFPPEVFYTCYAESVEECETKLKKQKEKQANSNSANRLDVRLSNDDDMMMQMLKKNIPNGISNKYWKELFVENSWENNDQARVRVLIKGGNFSLKRDILLSNENNSWKIFAFVEEGLHEAYAPAK